MLDLIVDLPRLAYADEIDTIVETYFVHRLMPLESGGDAHHLTLASFHRCNILITWNCQRRRRCLREGAPPFGYLAPLGCKYLRNGNKAGHIRLVSGLASQPEACHLKPPWKRLPNIKIGKAEPLHTLNNA